MGTTQELTGPDLIHGIADADVREDAPVLGHYSGEAVVLVRHAGVVHAVGATCTHYSGPLAEGIVADGVIRCPWHHACFDLTTGAAHGPALSPIACYDVALDNGKLRVVGKREVAAAAVLSPASVVIIGG